MIDNYQDLTFKDGDKVVTYCMRPSGRKARTQNKTNYMWCIFFGWYYSNTDHTKDRGDKGEKNRKREDNYCTP
jgi:hypothetical protein